MLKLSQPKIKLPKGYYFNIRVPRGKYDEVVIYLHNRNLIPKGQVENKSSCWAGGTRIGCVSLEPAWRHRKNKTRFYRTHSGLETAYHGKGLGTMMYAKAVQWALSRGYRVSSSGSSSTQAQRMWTGKSIRKYCKLVKRHTAYGNPIWYCYTKGAK